MKAASQSPSRPEYVGRTTDHIVAGEVEDRVPMHENRGKTWAAVEAGG